MHKNLKRQDTAQIVKPLIEKRRIAAIERGIEEEGSRIFWVTVSRNGQTTAANIFIVGNENLRLMRGAIIGDFIKALFFQRGILGKRGDFRSFWLLVKTYWKMTNPDSVNTRHYMNYIEKKGW